MAGLPSLFVPDNGGWLPTDHARGPWSPDALHGGPVAALVAREAERTEAATGAHATRLTMELLRPVPVAPLEVTAAVVRHGRVVSDIEVAVAAAGKDVAWGRVVVIRPLEIAAGDEGDPANDRRNDEGDVDEDSVQPPGPASGVLPAAQPLGTYTAFHNAGAELRFVAGRFDGAGPASVWIRLAVPVVPGETPSSMQRVAAAADFGNGVSAILPFDRYQFVNPDLTVYLSRPVAGEWVCLQARTRLGMPGVALAESSLFDEAGWIGRSVQSLVVQPRPG